MSKKTKALKLPKKVAGYKLSKPLRRSLGALAGLLRTPEAKALAATAMGAVVTHISERRDNRKHKHGHHAKAK
ncbi:MAG: hypothetical protein JF593_11190 [Novosphingobium sp.]|nr:hypothetical protein [Novosphingobium sp.]